MNVVQEFVTTRLDTATAPFWQSESLQCSWLLPRFPRSGHALALLRSDRRLVAVAKVARLPQTAERLRHEASILEVLRSRAIVGVPRLLGIDDFRGTTILVESAIGGQLLDRETASRSPEHCVTLVQGWLEQLHIATASSSLLDPDWFARLIEIPLARLDVLLQDQPSARALFRQTRELLRPLAEVELPLVLAHGDLSAPNLLIQPDGTCAVLDWETAEERSLPLSDFIFFLLFVGFARHGARKPSEFAAAYRHDIVAPAGWAMPYLSDFCSRTAIPPRIIPLLSLACLTRYLCRTGQDLGAAAPPGEVARMIAESRFYEVWQESVASAAGEL